MNPKKRSSSVWILIFLNVFWTLIVISSCLIYFSKSADNVEASGFLLAFAGLPSSMLVALFKDISVQMQIVLMALFGYLQWNLIGFIIGRLIGRFDKGGGSVRS